MIASWVQFHQHFTRSFCASCFMPILLAHGGEHRAQKLSLYLDVHTCKVGRIFVGETEQHQRMTTGAFALCT